MASDPDRTPPPTQSRPPPPTASNTPPSTRVVPAPPPSATAPDARTHIVVPPDEGDPVPPGCVPIPGQRLGDFQVLEVLGAGSFATVYLARQLSLGRQVALKVATNQDDEARTLASLEHQHIVHVFSETVDAERGLRLLCMQFVPGTDLDRVMRALAARDPSAWSEQAILDAIDAQCRHEAMFDLAALRDRDRLAGSDFVEAVCWLGSRLAEALAHAHSRGVLHRDIKPANILLNRYGRPLLSDFNLAFNPGRAEAHFGGTLRYMAPEHLDAFNPDSPVAPSAVDARSDIYSLGVVLSELLTGRPFLEKLPAGRTRAETLSLIAAERRAGAASPRKAKNDIPEVVDQVVRRCLAPDKALRYQKAEELVQALDGCRQLQKMERALPPAPAFTRLGTTHPALTLTALALVPHFLGSVVNITYNTISIVESLSAAQEQAFTLVMLAYNLLVYPPLIYVWCRAIVPLFRLRRRLAEGEAASRDEVGRLRRRAVNLPMLLVVLGCLGWLPGGVAFPLGISLLSEPVPASVFGHFIVSFTISGLIATTYSYFGVQSFALRILYPRLWVDPQRPRQQARRELAPLEGRLRMFQLTAGLIPLSGAVLMIGVSAPEHFTLGFRLLVVGLIGLGMAGFGVALLASGRLSRTLNVLFGGSDRAVRDRGQSVV